MRLIDADALIQKVKEEEEKRHLDKDDASLLHFFIQCYAQAVDAVPVIRCKDCRHREYGYCNLYISFYYTTDDMDYCSRAKRKEE